MATQTHTANQDSLPSPWSSWWPRSAQERLHYTLGMALLVHAFIILGVTFTPDRSQNNDVSLDVTLVSYNEERQEKADFLAQHDQQGSGDDAEAAIVSSTDTSELSADRPQEVYDEQLASIEPTRSQSELLRDETNRGEISAADEAKPTDTQEFIAERPYLDLAQQIATLQARIDREANNRAKGPRVRRITSVATKSAAEAYYLDAWRKQIETVGNLNYPAEARSRHLYGQLRLLVTIAADGQLQDVQLLESSGHDVLDEAAMRIVRLAAPFAPFPEDMRKKAEAIEIVRTWQFRKSRGEGVFRS